MPNPVEALRYGFSASPWIYFVSRPRGGMKWAGGWKERCFSVYPFPLYLSYSNGACYEVQICAVQAELLYFSYGR